VGKYLVVASLVLLALPAVLVGCAKPAAATGPPRAVAAPRPATLTVSLATTGPADTKAEKVTCIIEGTELEKSQAIPVAYKGYPAYACCEECVKTFTKDPMKYLKAALSTGNEGEMAVCPVQGTKMLKSKMIAAKYKGKTYYLCCKDCVPPSKAAWEKLVQKLAREAAEKASCMVHGTEMAKAKMIPVQHDGQIYYVCCPECVALFRKHPDKYIQAREKGLPPPE
jgi:YHS domain-containing protein